MPIPDYTAQTASTYKANIDETVDNTLIPNTTGGTADAYTATLGLTAYESGRLYVVRLDRANTTTTPTINFDSIGAKTIKHDDGSAMTAGEFRANQYAMFVYDGTDMLYVMPGDVHYATGGAYIGGTASANLLDDYEEGTSTIGLADNSLSDSEGQTYSTNKLWYTKIGSRVYINGRLALTSLGTLTTSHQARIIGLPLTSLSTSNSFGGISITDSSGLSVAAGTSITGNVAVNGTYIALNNWDAATGTSATLISNITASGDIIFIGQYPTA